MFTAPGLETKHGIVLPPGKCVWFLLCVSPWMFVNLLVPVHFCCRQLYSVKFLTDTSGSKCVIGNTNYGIGIWVVSWRDVRGTLGKRDVRGIARSANIPLHLQHISFTLYESTDSVACRTGDSRFGSMVSVCL